MRLKSIVLILFLLIAVSPLFARDIEIILEDTELGLPLEGAVIRSWDGLQYTCDADGKAIVVVPDDRQVVIQAAYPGYENGRLVIPIDVNQFKLGLLLSGIMESRELVIEASKPGTSETKTGRSVALSGRDIAQTAEIGIIEDVMSSVKLLPGVGYTGLFNAQPSIRGGDPGDMNAALNGYYVFNPYHWGGGFSIFDPRMVESAQLSHGVFTSRYGHTISGLLDITTKKPSPTETEYEAGVSTSAANLNLSFPLFGRGGILVMGKVTYYDPVVGLAKQLAKAVEMLRHVNAIRVAPYIRSGAVTGSYRFFNNLELQATGFWGMDGVGVHFNPDETGGPDTNILADFNYANYQGFITAGLLWNPRNDMLMKFTAGTGYEDSVVEGDMRNTIIDRSIKPTESNKSYYQFLAGIAGEDELAEPRDFVTNMFIDQSDTMFNAQGRIDYDWELGNGFLAAAGIQEMFTRYLSGGTIRTERERPLEEFSPEDQVKIFNSLNVGSGDTALRSALEQFLYIRHTGELNVDAGNKLFSTSGYVLGEYASADNRFGAELGLRIDHFFLLGRDFSLNSTPAVNPRLNLDFNVFKNKGIVQSLDLSAGTGLFSSVNDNVYIAEKEYNLTGIVPNRSLTSVLGVRLELPESIIFNIEAYYKHIFDRTYIPVTTGIGGITIEPKYNGQGKVWGIDAMLQKIQSRYFDGWISYSFSWAKYRDPGAGDNNTGISGAANGDDWYFPGFHRFHNLNLVLNIRPAPKINIYTRFGLASGVQISRRTTPQPISYPVYVYDDATGKGYFIEKFRWPSEPDENNRTTPSLPLDVKLSIFGSNANGKTRYEVYAAIENVLALLYTARGNTNYDPYSGEENDSLMSASYDIPIPIPSFGFKMSY